MAHLLAIKADYGLSLPPCGCWLLLSVSDTQGLARCRLFLSGQPRASIARHVTCLSAVVTGNTSFSVRLGPMISVARWDV